MDAQEKLQKHNSRNSHRAFSPSLTLSLLVGQPHRFPSFQIAKVHKKIGLSRKKFLLFPMPWSRLRLSQMHSSHLKVAMSCIVSIVGLLRVITSA